MVVPHKTSRKEEIEYLNECVSRSEKSANEQLARCDTLRSCLNRHDRWLAQQTRCRNESSATEELDMAKVDKKNAEVFCYIQELIEDFTHHELNSFSGKFPNTLSVSSSFEDILLRQLPSSINQLRLSGHELEMSIARQESRIRELSARIQEESRGKKTRHRRTGAIFPARKQSESIV